MNKIVLCSGLYDLMNMHAPKSVAGERNSNIGKISPKFKLIHHMQAKNQCCGVHGAWHMKTCECCLILRGGNLTLFEF